LKHRNPPAVKRPVLVAPRAGAWIETRSVPACPWRAAVAPRAGAWIETYSLGSHNFPMSVAPRAGAWIETGSSVAMWKAEPSPPARGRGLKLLSRFEEMNENLRRPPRGGVD